MAKTPHHGGAGAPTALNRAGLIAAVADDTGLTSVKAGAAVDAAIRAIQAALQARREVRLTGFGSFAVTRRKASTGRNPRTGHAIRIGPSSSVKFRPGRLLKNAVGEDSD